MQSSNSNKIEKTKKNNYNQESDSFYDNQDYGNLSKKEIKALKKEKRKRSPRNNY